MSRLYRLKLLVVSLCLMFGIAGGTVAMASAVSSGQTNACAGLDQLDTGAGCGGGGESNVKRLVTDIVQFISVIAGLVAVVAIIYGGFQLITASGDSNNIAKGRTTLIYAVVALFIVALAQFMVHFVLSTFQP